MPASVPFLFASLKVAIAISLVGAIVGELPTGAAGGPRRADAHRLLLRPDGPDLVGAADGGDPRHASWSMLIAGHRAGDAAPLGGAIMRPAARLAQCVLMAVGLALPVGYYEEGLADRLVAVPRCRSHLRAADRRWPWIAGERWLRHRRGRTVGLARRRSDRHARPLAPADELLRLLGRSCVMAGCDDARLLALPDRVTCWSPGR